MAAEVLTPTSPDEAASLFGEGKDLTVFGGGTILLPEIAAGRLKPTRALMLHRSGLDSLEADGNVVRIGAMTTIAALIDGTDDLLTRFAEHVADGEVRRNATVGGNLCASPGIGSQRGDLGAPLIALGARVRSAGKGGERTEPVEDFVSGDRSRRLVLSIEYDRPSGKTAAEMMRRRHAHSYAIANVAICASNGALRIGISGVGPLAVRARSVEQSRNADDVLKDVEPVIRRACLGRVPAKDAAPARAASPRPTGERMNLTVNGREHEITSAPLTPLLHVLREELEITSPKAGCQQGGCGTCTVLVDGEPRRSCLTAVATVDGASITTLEGLGEAESLSPVQAAFHEHYAAQCGFCTPGMVVAATALIERVGGPVDRDDILDALGGHYCRCTGYVKIIDAVMAASRGEVGKVEDLPTSEDGEPDIAIKGSPA